MNSTLITANVVGNMGAPLRTGEFRDSGEDGEEAQCSDDPFNFDLVPEPAAGQGRGVDLGAGDAGRADLITMSIEAGQLGCIHEV